ncbi:MAG: prepilin-type N-terminal cleavage/methylation domain-containing protein [Planctomycetia bacterium]|nr:prepilin-type N-terminal cleavage/methylation domain-containing protein [Planctomycetia bacterium]
MRRQKDVRFAFPCISVRRNVRRGFTLLEVLISCMVIVIGLLGIAALIPAGKIQFAQAMQKDMAANYGRAGLRTIMTSGYLKTERNGIQYINWTAGGGEGNRIYEGKDNGFDYYCSDDLVSGEVAHAEYPEYYTDVTYSNSNFQWVATVCSLGNGFYEVSAAVCCRRPTQGFTTTGTFTGGYGGGDITLTVPNTEDGRVVSSGEWVFVSSGTYGCWYKVVMTGFDQGSGVISVSGPDWRGPQGVTVASPGNVVGVYTEVMSGNTR